MAHGKACWKEYPFAAKCEGDPGCRGLLQGTMPFGVSFFMFSFKVRDDLVIVLNASAEASSNRKFLV